MRKRAESMLAAPGLAGMLRAGLYALALVLPSVAWSAAFRGLFVCVDPLVFPFIEKKFGSRIATAIKLLWVACFLFALLRALNIMPGSYGFYLGAVLRHTPPVILAALALFVAILVLACFLCVPKVLPARHVRAAALAACVLFGAKIVLVSGAVQLDGLTRSIVTPGLAASRVMAEHLVSGSPTGALPHREQLTADRTFYRFIQGQPALPKKIVLAVVESWAESEDSLARIEAELKAGGVNVLASGFTAYYGFTLQGEFRELCAEYIELSEQAVAGVARRECAPALLHRQGYQVTGLHGYYGKFYTRSLIWKALGIHDSFFLEQMRPAEPCTGPFEGMCDDELIERGISLLKSSDKSFVYMLTLTSHEPVPATHLVRTGDYFTSLPVAGGAQLVSRNAVGKVVGALRENVSDCVLAYVVGDHHPPTMKDNRAFQRGQVPFVVMSFNCQ